MKYFILGCLLFLANQLNAQKAITIQSSYYGNKSKYENVFISTDSSFLSALKVQNGLSDIRKMKNQLYILVNEDLFSSLYNYIKQWDYNVSVENFPQPFREIYYISTIEGNNMTTRYLINFSGNRERARKYFNDLSLKFKECDSEELKVVLQSILKSLDDKK
ncbi:hypothetical protein D3C71_52870 [compost metagenome]